MKNDQLLKLLITNRELIQRNNAHAEEHLQMLKKDYSGLDNEEIILNLELNNSLAEYHFHSHFPKAIENSLRVVEKYKDSQHKNIIARHYLLIGLCYAHIGDYENAKKFLRITLMTLTPNQPEFITTKTDTLVALAMNEEIAEKDHQKAIEYLEEALNMLQGKGSEIRKAACLMGLGNVYINTQNIERALEHYFAAADIYEQFFDLANMASAYSNVGTCYIETNSYEKAEQYLQKSLELRLKLGSPEQVSISYHNLALIYKHTDRLELAYDYLLKSRDILLQTGNKPSLMDTEELLKEVIDMMQKVTA